MDSFEINKIIAAILMTALVIIGIGKLADAMFHVDKPKESAYKIDGVEVASSGDTKIEKKAETAVVDINALLAMGDVSHGERYLKNAVHAMIVSDGKNMIGPNLWGVIGRQAGSISDYKYSKAMVAYGKSGRLKK